MPTRSWGAALLFLCLAGLEVQARTTVGVVPSNRLDLDTSPVFRLLEVELSGDETLDLVERAQVESLIEEQRLQLAFGAQSGPERRELGELLQADILVLLDPGESDDGRTIRMVISRTRDGIRLADTLHDWSDEHPEGLVAELHGRISDAVRKSEQRQGKLIAVSPFASDDLLRTYDYLQSTYAGLIERYLGSQTGLFAVEIEEARALADEFSLTGGEGIQRSALPFFVQGSYRNEGAGEDRRMRIGLELLRSAEVLFATEVESISPEEVPHFLQSAAAEMTAILTETEAVEFDPLTEALELARRGASFRRAGDYEKALAFYESSLLVEPELKVHHQSAMILCQHLTEQYLEGAKRTQDTLLSGQIGMGYALRGLDHLDRYLRAVHPVKADGLFRDLSNHSDNSVSRFVGQYAFTAAPLAIQDLVNEYVRKRQEIFVSFCEELHSRGILTRGVAARLLTSLQSFGGHVQPPDGNPSFRPLQLRLVALASENQSLFRSIVDTIRYARKRSDRSEADEEFLRALEASTSPNVRMAFRVVEALEAPIDREGLVEELTELHAWVRAIPGGIPNIPHELEHKLAAANQAAEAAPPPSPTPTPEIGIERNERGMRLASVFTFHKEAPDFQFIPITELAPNPMFPQEDFEEWKFGVTQWVDLENGLDLIVTRSILRTLDREGRVDTVHVAGRSDRYRPILVQEKWVWVPIISRNPAVLAFSLPSMEKTVFNASDGLPPTDQAISLYSIEPGKVLAIGRFDRTWIGVLTLSGKGEKHFELIHEARNPQGAREEIETAFTAGNIWRFESDDRPGDHLVAVNRTFPIDPGAPLGSRQSGQPDPLVVNLTTGAITLEKVPTPQRTTTAPDPMDIHRSEEFRRAGSDFEKRQQLLNEHNRRVQEFGNQLTIDGVVYAFGREAVWIMGDAEKGEEPTRLNGQVPQFETGFAAGAIRVFRSNRFGVVYQVQDKLYQVVLNSRGGEHP